MTSTIKLSCLFRCKINRSVGLICDSHLHLSRSYSHVSWKSYNCFSSQSRKLLHFSRNQQIMANNIAWSSTSGSSGPLNDNLDLGPLNISKIAEELSKLANADKVGTSPAVSGDIVTVTDIDLTEFTSEIGSSIPEALLTASDVGLTWWAPTNIVFKSLTALHDNLPWWASIIALTVCVRMILFPVMVKNMKSATNITKNLKTLEEKRTEFKEAMNSGNQIIQLQSAMELIEMTKKNHLGVFKSMSPMIVMGIIFSSNFFAIRAMANHPLESMKTEGLYWFTDLTVPDPYFILPTLTSVTLYFVMTSGNETVPVDPLSAKALQIMPIILCPVIFLVGSAFPAALGTYWLTNNLISLGQGFILRKTRIRDILNIPEPKASSEMAKGSFQSTMEMQKDIQIATEIVQRFYKAKIEADLKTRSEKKEKDKN